MLFRSGELEAEFTITNEGDAPLEVSEKITSGGDTFAVDAAGFTISEGSAITVHITFSADTEAVYGGTLRVYSNDTDEGQLDVGLTATVGTDGDGDGYAAADDCDDTDPAINPGATETWYDGIDQNCDDADDYDQDEIGRAHV